MKHGRICICALGGLLLIGCSSVSPTRLVTNTVGAAGGALVGNHLSDGDSLLTAAGAGAGLLLGETLSSGSNEAQRNAYAAGYEKGQSDSAKRQYQALIERQRFGPEPAAFENVSLFEVPLPERQINGVTLAPSTATLRIQE